jgi:uncharacterized Tic20 family protein
MKFKKRMLTLWKEFNNYNRKSYLGFQITITICFIFIWLFVILVEVPFFSSLNFISIILLIIFILDDIRLIKKWRAGVEVYPLIYNIKKSKKK